MPSTTQPAHADCDTLGDSWELALRADGYAKNTLASYRRALATFGTWLHTIDPELAPADVTRELVRRWVVHVRETTTSGTAGSWFAGLRNFFRWTAAEGERTDDPTAGIKTPPPTTRSPTSSAWRPSKPCSQRARDGNHRFAW
ncbi:site-specific integrase [Dactylosporangium sp. CA-139114]|uniref:site-specific integrase n=1 Tax=Dactylosporangium sp. CA-139114 TaxID=3239931 RepID=UPI003D98E93D